MKVRDVLTYECRADYTVFFLFCAKLEVIFIPRITFEQAAKEFTDHGYTLLDHDAMSTKKMEYVCNKHPDMPHQYVDLPHLRRGHGCKYCRAERRGNRCVDEDTVIKLCAERGFQFVSLGSDKRRSIIQFICNKHINKGIQSMNLQTLRKCHGCRYCAGKDRTTTDFVRDLNNSNIEILGEYINVRTKIECKCKIDGNIWWMTPNSLLNGQGCPVCGRKKCAKSKTKTNEQFLAELVEKNPNS